MNARQLNALRAQFGTLERCTVEHYNRLKALVGQLPLSSIETLADSGIRFIGTAANSVLCDRGIRPESARWEHAIDTMTDSLLAEYTRSAVA